jgi:hypothetical protein
MRLLDGYKNFGHTVVVDNFFASLRLFNDHMVRGFWGMGTIKVNRVGLLHALSKAKRKTKKVDHGNIVIQMHSHH